jgi:hypothetical protein
MNPILISPPQPIKMYFIVFNPGSDNKIAMTERIINAILKSICWFQERSSKIPPQEQGIKEL